MESISRKAVLENLSEMVSFAVNNISTKVSVSDAFAFKIKLICEEVLVNILSYAYADGEGEMCLSYEIDDDKQHIIMIFSDYGIEFNPLNQKPAVIADDVMDQQIGGFGIFFVQSYSESVEYERRGNKNLLTAILNVEMDEN